MEKEEEEKELFLGDGEDDDDKTERRFRLLLQSSVVQSFRKGSGQKSMELAGFLLCFG